MTKKHHFTLYEVIISFFVISTAMFIVVTLLATGMDNIKKSQNKLYPDVGSTLVEPYVHAYLTNAANWSTATASSPSDLANIPYQDSTSINVDQSTATGISAFRGALSGVADWKDELMEQNSGNAVYSTTIFNEGLFELKSQGKGVHSISFITTTSKGQIKKNFGLNIWYGNDSTVYTTIGEISSTAIPSFVEAHYVISWPTTIPFKNRISQGNYFYKSLSVIKE